MTQKEAFQILEAKKNISNHEIYCATMEAVLTRNDKRVLGYGAGPIPMNHGKIKKYTRKRNDIIVKYISLLGEEFPDLTPNPEFLDDYIMEKFYKNVK
jgi:hypothetical protein